MTEKEQLIRKISELTIQLRKVNVAIRMLKSESPLEAIFVRLPQGAVDDAAIRQAVMTAVSNYIERLKGELKTAAERL